MMIERFGNVRISCRRNPHPKGDIISEEKFGASN
jgi:hypothetical protein